MNNNINESREIDYSLRFSPCSSFLAVSSDKGTIHIFTVRDQGDDKWSSKRTILQQVGLIKDEARRSCAQFSLPNSDQVAEVAFVSSANQTRIGGHAPGTVLKKQSVIAICTDGTYHRFMFTSDGMCTREGFDYFLDLGDEQEFWSTQF
ncbi:unnamed protein product [Anisakis simplex]|uniref:WD repeat-containing protein 45 n=1 Tax=Anisakis simplex TaxID=6269 RepID=A0A0M3KD78_ANISI|nr:unnamed protein product [Anisakis simplex]